MYFQSAKGMFRKKGIEKKKFSDLPNFSGLILR